MTVDEGQLEASLHELARLGTGRLELTELLTRVARGVVGAIPGADGAGLMLIEEDRRDTVVATAEFVRDVDEVQYRLRQGPCLTAVAEARTVRCGSLGGDRRWPAFGGAVARMNVHSVVSLPLLSPDGVVGAMNVYARAKHVFDDQATAMGEAFAAPAAVAVQNAQLLAQAQRLAARLQSAVATRDVIERAVGILMSRGGGDERAALQRLQALSQRDHRKLAVTAAQIVDEAVREARARLRTG